MTWDPAQAVARALLYEGYLLYPYRRSGLKNHKRWAFGTLYPPSHASSGERSALTTQVLVRGAAPKVRAAASFLQWVERSDPGRTPWREALERTIETRSVALVPSFRGPTSLRFGFAAEAWGHEGHRYASASI